MADAICYTSNGNINSKGENVMGKGIALAFKTRFPGIQRAAGVQISKAGNHVCLLAKRDGVNLVSFPTKNNFWHNSDLGLIVQSAHELMALVEKQGWKCVYLPRPGTGLGGLNYDRQVKPAIENILDDRIIVCSL